MSQGRTACLDWIAPGDDGGLWHVPWRLRTVQSRTVRRRTAIALAARVCIAGRPVPAVVCRAWDRSVPASAERNPVRTRTPARTSRRLPQHRRIATLFGPMRDLVLIPRVQDDGPTGVASHLKHRTARAIAELPPLPTAESRPAPHSASRIRPDISARRFPSPFSMVSASRDKYSLAKPGISSSIIIRAFPMTTSGG